MCVFNKEPRMTRPTLIDLNPIQLIYFPIMITLDKCNGSCNVPNDLFIKICVRCKTKDVNINLV